MPARFARAIECPLCIFNDLRSPPTRRFRDDLGLAIGVATRADLTEPNVIAIRHSRAAYPLGQPTSQPIHFPWSR
jgi:hypothetical protein